MVIFPGSHSEGHMHVGGEDESSSKTRSKLYNCWVAMHVFDESSADEHGSALPPEFAISTVFTAIHQQPARH